MRGDSGLLWHILIHKYNGGFIEKALLWWKNLYSICYESGNCDWIEESVCRRMGDGRDTVFWFTDRCGHGVLKDKFPRLFNLSNQQQAHVSDVGGWNAIV